MSRTKRVVGDIVVWLLWLSAVGASLYALLAFSLRVLTLMVRP